MKTEVTRPLKLLWQAFSEVPGWPDAPLPARLRRLWPLVVPLAACIVIVVWVHGVREPFRVSVRAARAELQWLEQENEALRATLSEQTATEVNRQAAEARASLLDGPPALEARLATFAPQARARGWEASSQVYGLAEDTGPNPAAQPFAFIPARVRLEPRPGNPDRFNSLLEVLGTLAALPGRVEMTRVAVRSDAEGIPFVEVNLRAACRPPDEKTAQ